MHGMERSRQPRRAIAAPLRCTAAALALVLAPGSAWAFQPPSWAAQGFCAAAPIEPAAAATVNPAAKTEAILGTRSKLDELKAQQAAAERAMAPERIDLAQVRAPEPAAGPGLACVRPPAFAIRTAPTASPFGAAASLPMPDTGNPDVFGSVALAVSRTPLDGKWRKVRNARLSAQGGPWSALVRDARGMDGGARIDAVNRWVNARVSFVDDSRRFNTADQWGGAAQTLAQGRGDCEDYAIAKMKLLEAAGVERRDMFLVIARDLVRRADHALLVVRHQGRLMVLDNNTDRIVDAATIRDYRPIMSYSADKAWIHGYAVQPAPVQLAAHTR
jgi:predicted transglutaminase-like cysteine proteinase